MKRSYIKRKLPAFPKQRKPLRRVSKKRAKLHIDYRRAKQIWREGHDGRCEMRMYYIQGTPVGVTLERSQCSQFEGYYYPGTRTGTNSRCSAAAQPDPHHLALRGPNLCRIETFCGLCAAHHRWVHEHANEARRFGYLIDANADSLK